MLFIDIELTRDTKKNKKRRRFDRLKNEVEKKNASILDEKKRNR